MVKINPCFFGYMDMDDDEFSKIKNGLFEGPDDSDTDIDDEPIEPVETTEGDSTDDTAPEDNSPLNEGEDDSQDDSQGDSQGNTQAGTEGNTAQGQPQKQDYGRYTSLIETFETDEGFRNMIAEALIERRNQQMGISAQKPQPATEDIDADKEPEMGDDEPYEDFEKRHQAWEQQQEDKRFKEQFDSYVQQKQQEQYQRQMAEKATRYAKMAQEDPEKQAVIDFYQNNPMPEKLQQLVQTDPDIFAYVYDGMRSLAGKGYYFANPQSPNANTGEKQKVSQPTNQPTPQGRTIVKGGRDVPFVEGGGGNIRRGGGSVPRINEMSDNDFLKFMNNVKMQELK